MKELIFAALITVTYTSCISQPTSQVKSTINYSCKEIGWTFEYPSDWKILSQEEIAILEGRGKVAMESTIGDEIRINNKNLLWLKKDPFNSFTSTIQPYDTIVDGKYSESQTILTQLLIETYRNQGMQFDYKIGSELIDGLEFATLETIIYSPDRKKVIMNQIMYDRLINGKTSLTLSINFNNDENKQSLMSIIKTSKFSQRE